MRPVSVPRANRDTTQSELPAYPTAPEATACSAVDPAQVPLKAEVPASRFGMYLDLAAMEARHPEVGSGCRASIAARSRYIPKRDAGTSAFNGTWAGSTALHAVASGAVG